MGEVVHFHRRDRYDALFARAQALGVAPDPVDIARMKADATLARDQALSLTQWLRASRDQPLNLTPRRNLEVRMLALATAARDRDVKRVGATKSSQAVLDDPTPYLVSTSECDNGLRFYQS